MSARRYRTLSSKNGQISIKEEDPLDIPEEFASWDGLTSRDQFEVFAEFLKFERGHKESPDYVPREEFEELKERFNILEQKLFGVIEEETNPQNIGSILENVRIRLANKSNRLCYKYQNHQLKVFMVLEKFSKKCLDEISKTEVELSKLFPKIAIEIEPLANCEDIPEGSHEILVK